MSSAVRILNLLPILICEYRELTLINQLNELFHFDHNVFLLESSVTVNSNCFTRNLQSECCGRPQSLHVFGNVNDKNITEWTNHIDSKNTFIIVAFDTGHFDSTVNLLKQIHRVGGINRKFGVFFSQFISIDNLRKLFEWCWEYRIIDIFVATHVPGSKPSLMHIFTYNPFGTFNVIDVTADGSLDRLFLTQNPDFQRQPLVFAQHYEDGASSIPFWTAILHAMNATYRTYNASYNRSSFVDQNIDVIPIILGQYDTKDLVMYPLHFYSITIMVPEADYYTDFISYLATVTSDPLFYSSLIVIGMVMLLLSVFRRFKQSKFLLFESVVDVVNLLLNDNAAIEYQQLSTIENCLMLPLTFAGFVFVNGFLSNFKSLLTRPVKRRQINSIEELYRSSVPIFGIDSWMSFLIKWATDLTGHSGWDQRLIPIEAPAMLRIARGYNRTCAYSMVRHRAQQILDVQNRLKILGFHLTPDDLDTTLTSYLVSNRFPFLERLNDIVHRTKSSGLYDYWYKETDIYDHQVILWTYSEVHTAKTNETIQQSQSPLSMFIVYGWGAGTLVFIIEILCHKFNISMKFAGILRKLRRILTKKFLHITHRQTI